MSPISRLEQSTVHLGGAFKKRPQKTWLVSLLILFLWSPISALGNICGTDYQNFNPTTGGLDFITVHSSETLKPCVGNFGFFTNYAVNSLTYSKTINSNIVAGEKPSDSLLYADFSLGFGLAKNWDMGINIPLVVDQQIKNPYYVSYFDKTGVTEVKLNTKYRFVGNEKGGFAAVFSINNNLIQDNPFAGSGASPTLNLDLVADSTFGNFAVGANIGYRKRTPGDPIPNQPFLPLKDQYTYSIAASILMAAIDTKLVGEIYGAQAAKKSDQDLDKSLKTLETVVGLKHDWNSKLALHLGAGAEILDSVGGPDWRVYAGINYAFGPICKSEQQVTRVAPVKNLPTLPLLPLEPEEDEETLTPEIFEGKAPEVYRIRAEVLFDTDSDYIRTDDVPEIDDLINELNRKGFKKMVIDGHTDSVGKEAYNLDLSKRRANRLISFLSKRYRVNLNKMEARGFGESRPIASNNNYQGRQKNRRVEFNIYR